MKRTISPEAYFVAFVFFTVLSQVILYAGADTISKPFRPLIVLILAVMAFRRGRMKMPVCRTALAMSVYQFLIWFFYYPNGGPISNYLQIILYFMMLFSVVSFPWNKRELQLIIYAVFLATFVCAAVFFISNDMLNFNPYAYYFLGQIVNRNKNAYAFAIGLILGWYYLSLGRGRNKLLIILMMLLEGYCLIYSQCRGAFIGCFLALCVVALNKAADMYRKGNPYLLMFILFFLLSCVLGYLLIKNSPASRLVDGEHMSGRDEGIKHAWNLFMNVPILRKIFGNGAIYEADHTEGVGVHMVYLTYLLEGGVIASGMAAIVFLQTMIRIRGAIQWSLFIFAFSKTFFEGMDYYVFIPLILAICISNYVRIYGCSDSIFFRKERS